MKVLVDATMLDGRPSGAATRLAGLARAHARRGAVDVVHLVRPDVEPLPGAPCHVVDGLHTPWGRWRAGRRLDALARELGADLFHAGALPLPRLRAVPTVLTLHDLRLTDPAGAGSRGRRLWSALRLSAHLARPSHVVAVSRTTADGLVAAGLRAADEVSVVPNGPSPGLALVADPEPIAAFRRRAEINRRYLISVGPLAAHKRVGELLETLAAVGQRADGADLGLVLAGRADPEAALTVSRRAARLGLTGRLRITAVLDDATLSAALTGAEAVVFAGRHEGFSIPALDALSLGLPVVAPRAGAFPEVLEDCGWLYPPGDVEAAAAAWLAAVALREDEATGARARARAAAYDWDRSAGELEAVWADALAGTRPGAR